MNYTLFFAIIFVMCTKSDNPYNNDIIDTPKGKWICNYNYNELKNGIELDTVHTTLLNLGNNLSLTVEQYDDSSMVILEKSYSGTYKFVGDSIDLIFNTWKERYKWEYGINGELILFSGYMTDENNIKVTDFNSVLWKSVKIRKGIFTKYN